MARPARLHPVGPLKSDQEEILRCCTRPVHEPEVDMVTSYASLSRGRHPEPGASRIMGSRILDHGHSQQTDLQPQGPMQRAQTERISHQDLCVPLLLLVWRARLQTLDSAEVAGGHHRQRSETSGARASEGRCPDHGFVARKWRITRQELPLRPVNTAEPCLHWS